jgi:hypothetical protein
MYNFDCETRWWKGGESQNFTPELTLQVQHGKLQARTKQVLAKHAAGLLSRVHDTSWSQERHVQWLASCVETSQSWSHKTPVKFVCRQYTWFYLIFVHWHWDGLSLIWHRGRRLWAINSCVFLYNWTIWRRLTESAGQVNHVMMDELFQQAITMTSTPVACSDFVQCEQPYFWRTVNHHRK